MKLKLILTTAIAAAGIGGFMADQASVASAAWTVTPTPNVAARTSLFGVDCSSANSCIAVGEATFGHLSPFDSAAVAERWDGTSWQIMPTPTTSGSLFGISCPQPSVCLAVGTLHELWDGTSWSIQPNPPDVQGLLGDVSCSGLLACTAVGYVSTATGANIRTLAERWDGSGWHVQSTPNITGSDTGDLSGVSCPLRRTCTAVGQSVTGQVASPLVERWFGRVNAWGLQATPEPDGAQGVGLRDVSCPNGRLCVVVGASYTQQGQSSVMAARRFGLGSWSVFPLTTLPGPASFLSGVDCSARHFCQATGNWGSGAIAERFDGVSWQAEGIPTNGLPSPFLADVSCPSRFFCMAVGDTASGPIGDTLAAKWTP
jgi:hypothetical protein